MGLPRGLFASFGCIFRVASYNEIRLAPLHCASLYLQLSRSRIRVTTTNSFDEVEGRPRSANLVLSHFHHPIILFIHKTPSQAVLFHYRVARYIIYSLLHTDRYAGYQMLAYIHVHVHDSTEDIRPIRLGFRTQEEPLRLVHSRKRNPIRLPSVQNP